MSIMQNKRRARLGMVALATAGLVALAGCSSADGGDSAGPAGEGPLHAGLPWGSSAEEFAAAVADMDPVHLTIQSSAPSAASSRAWTSLQFKERVEEYSGGKIEVDAEGRTSMAKVWAGGDCATGGDDLTVTAVAEGRDPGDLTTIEDPSTLMAIKALMGK